MAKAFTHTFVRRPSRGLTGCGAVWNANGGLTMRISAKGEYATKAVLYLSLKHPATVTIHEIAENQSIPLKYLEQILLQLRRARLLESHRGVRGGYTLARCPEEISIGEVLRAVDGRFSQTGRAESNLPEHSCPEANSGGLKQVWSDVQSAMDRILFETTFDDVRKRTLAGAVERSASATLEI